MKTKLTALFLEFFESGRASGIILLASAITAMLVANSPYGKEFLGFWHIEIGYDLGPVHLRHSILHWINDGLMAIFFLLIGLEIERDLFFADQFEASDLYLTARDQLSGDFVGGLIDCIEFEVLRQQSARRALFHSGAQFGQRL